jgi:hypothetical protein
MVRLVFSILFDIALAKYELLKLWMLPLSSFGIDGGTLYPVGDLRLLVDKGITEVNFGGLPLGYLPVAGPEETFEWFATERVLRSSEAEPENDLLQRHAKKRKVRPARQGSVSLKLWLPELCQFARQSCS